MENLNSNTKRLAVAGMLGAFSIVLSVTPFLGYIPIPFLVGVNATTMHIPIIIAALLLDAKVATFVGLIFGVSSFLRATPAFFSDPLVSILPRLLIGVTTYYAYRATKSSIFAAAVGTITNTAGVLTMIYLRGYLPLELVGSIAAVNGTAEVIISAIIVYSIMKIFKNKKI